jgi:hypothetical protein
VSSPKEGVVSMSRTIIDAPSSRDQFVKSPAGEYSADAWRPLYRMGAVAALLSVAFIFIAAIVYAFSQPPTTVTGWFELYHKNWLLGLFAGDLMMLVSNLVLGVIYIALYGALRHANQPFMALATALGFVAIAAYFASNPAFSLLSLSNQYAAATTDAERMTLLGAGQAVIAGWTGTAFNIAYLLGAVVALIVALVMLRSHNFSKPTAYAGLAMGVLGLVPATAGMVGIVISLLTLVPTVIWLVLIARRLFKLASAPVGNGL